MDKEKFLSWESHPQTQEVFKFWQDYRQDLVEKWASGAFISEKENWEAITKAQMAFTFANLAPDAISEFYQSRKEVRND